MIETVLGNEDKTDVSQETKAASSFLLLPLSLIIYTQPLSFTNYSVGVLERGWFCEVKLQLEEEDECHGLGQSNRSSRKR